MGTWTSMRRSSTCAGPPRGPRHAQEGRLAAASPVTAGVDARRPRDHQHQADRLQGPARPPRPRVWLCASPTASTVAGSSSRARRTSWSCPRPWTASSVTTGTSPASTRTGMTTARPWSATSASCCVIAGHQGRRAVSGCSWPPGRELVADAVLGDQAPAVGRAELVPSRLTCTSTVRLSAAKSRCQTRVTRSERVNTVDGCAERNASSSNSWNVSAISAPSTQTRRWSWSSSSPDAAAAAPARAVGDRAGRGRGRPPRAR